MEGARVESFMSRPTLIDNRKGNTLAQALSQALSVFDPNVGQSLNSPDQVRIATAFFSPTGFSQIADHLTGVKNVRLLLGADLANDVSKHRKLLDETFSAYEHRRIQSGLENQIRGLERERDHLPFNRTNGAALTQLIAALRAGNLEVRRYEKTFLHAKAYIFSTSSRSNSESQGIFVGSSNLTGAGLSQNLELNIGEFDNPVTEEAKEWFDDIWEESEAYDLAKIFEVVFEPMPPWIVFVRVLWQLYGGEVEEDVKADDNLPLTSFQKHGVARAIRLIRETGGVIVADEVGLGKTFIAGEILQMYLERRQRALLICPASLRDSTWKRFLTRYQLFIECLSFEQLANDEQLRDKQRPNADQRHLQRKLDEYQLIIVDEAHNYRNPDAPTRAAALRHLLFGKRRDLLLLTATPVNNSLWDLYHLLRFFLRQDAHFANRGILSIRERFKAATRKDPSDLNPDYLYPIIDATTVKRTRQFVKKHYAGDRISGPDGRPQPIVFPTPKAISLRYALENRLPGFFDLLEDALDSERESALKFARYTPNVYLYDKEDVDEKVHTHAMIGLLKSGLLKRFESSTFAFCKTVEKMVRENQYFLEALDSGYIVTTAFMREVSADDESVFEDLLTGTEHRHDASRYDVDQLRKVVERDRDILKNLADEARKITPATDSKLKILTNALVEIAQQANTEAIDAVDEAQKRKVLVFSYFEDTVKWIRDYLSIEINANPDLAPFRNRMIAVSGSDELAEVSAQKAVQGFAPVSMEAPEGQDDDLYDLVIATDVLAEGVNLQQCRNIINFDVPWNPMRLVQRHGRIDRIGSPHNHVFMRTIFPADRLDDLLNLEQRILGKLAQAAATIGVETPIEGAARGTQVFTETREEIEKLIKEDASLYERGGTAGAAQTGEEYRQALRKALKQDADLITRLPWKIGSGMIKGKRSGIFFCVVVGSETQLERTYVRFVPSVDNWKPVDHDEEIESELGTCLRLIECEEDAQISCPETLRRSVYDFWEIAQNHILRSWMRETDPANLQPRIRPLNHRVAEFIREQTLFETAFDQVRRALDILESPWPRREEIMLREWFETNELQGSEHANYLIGKIIETGIEPTDPPKVLPPISIEDIELFCWIGIEAEKSV